MKEEEFNDFLRDRADSFELKPTSGSFDAVERKLKKAKKKKRALFFILPLLLLAGATTIYWGLDNSSSTATGNKLVKADDTVENNEPKNAVTANTEAKSSSTKEKQLIHSDDVQQKEETKTTLAKAKPANTPKAIYTKTNTGKSQKAEPQLQDNKKTVSKEQKSITPKEKETKKITSDPVIETKETKPSTESIAEKENKNEPTEEILAAKKPAEKKRSSPTSKDSTKCNCDDKKWAVTASYMPFGASYLFGNSFYQKDEAISISQQSANAVKSNNVEEFLNGGFRLGIGVERKLGKKLNIGLGLQYSRWSMDVSEWRTEQRRDSVAVYRFDTNSNQIVRDGYVAETKNETLDSSSTSVQFTNILVPVKLGYNLFNSKRWSISAEAYGAFNYLHRVNAVNTLRIRNQSRVPSQDNFEEYNYIYKTFNLNFGAGLVGQYNIISCLGLYVAPRLETTLFTIHSQNATANRRPVFYGVETGLRLKF